MIRLIPYVLFFSTVLQQSVAQTRPDSTAAKLWQPYRITPRTGTQHVDLSGGGWELSHTDKPVANLTEKRKDAFQTGQLHQLSSWLKRLLRNSSSRAALLRLRAKLILVGSRFNKPKLILRTVVRLRGA